MLPARPRIGIVVPTADPAKHPAEKALRLVRETTSHLDARLEAVQSSGPGFRLSRSINEGIDRTSGADAWVLLNDDAWMDPGWLDAMIAAARSDDRVGIVGAVLRFQDGRIQHAGGHFPLTPGEFLVEATKRKAPLWGLREIRRRGWDGGPFMYAHWHRVDRRHRLDFVTGACVLVTRACMEKVGRWDDAYTFGFEDTDHCLRALESGFELALAAKATGIHLEGASGLAMSQKQLESEKVFRARWSAERIRKATRANGRIGVYHGLEG